MSGLVLAMGVAAPLLFGGGVASANPGDRALLNVETGFVLFAPQNGVGKVVEGTQVQLKRQNATDQSQKWIKISNQTSTTYQLRNAFVKKNGQAANGCLDLVSDAPRSQQQVGAAIVVRPCDGTNSQKWGRAGVQGITGQEPRFRLINLVSAMSIDVGGFEFAKATQQPDDNTIAVTSQTFSEPVVN